MSCAPPSTDIVVKVAIGSTDMATRKSITAVSGTTASGATTCNRIASSCTSSHCVMSTSSQVREAARKVLAMTQKNSTGSSHENLDIRQSTLLNIAA